MWKLEFCVAKGEGYLFQAMQQLGQTGHAHADVCHVGHCAEAVVCVSEVM